jgi:membrane protease YdiL (CAAX protease family)
MHLASWWKRSLFFFIITILFTIFLTEFNIPATYTIFISLLTASIITEALRSKGYLLLFGLYPTKKTLTDIIYSFLFAVTPYLILLLIFHFAGIKFTLKSFPPEILLTLFLYIFINAFIEELIFRGIIFQAILNRFGYIVAILISGIAFASAHLTNNNFTTLAFINTLIAGILLGTMYLQSRSLYLPVFFHSFWNLLQWITGSNLSGWEVGYNFIDIDYTLLPVWLFGGNYGIEGGLYATAILLIILYFTLKLIKPSPYVTSKLFKRQFTESLF